MTFFLMDGRAAENPDDASVLLTCSSLREAKKERDSGDYGYCLITDENCEVLWEHNGDIKSGL